MQKKLRKENLPFVLASADRGSSWQPPIGRTLELGLRRSVTSLLPHARAYCERRDEFLRVCYVVASRVSIFLTFCPPSFLPTSHVPCFLQINGFLGLIYCLVFLGWLASPGERERERELSRAREILCAGKEQEGEFFVSSSCNEGKAYAPEFFFQILFFFLFLSKSG